MLFNPRINLQPKGDEDTEPVLPVLSSVEGSLPKEGEGY